MSHKGVCVCVCVCVVWSVRDVCVCMCVWECMYACLRVCACVYMCEVSGACEGTVSFGEDVLKVVGQVFREEGVLYKLVAAAHKYWCIIII